MEVKLPKPGDQLPFVVAEWEEGEYKFRILYNKCGKRVRETFLGDEKTGWFFNAACARIAQMAPYEIDTAAFVAPTEGGEE